MGKPIRANKARPRRYSVDDGSVVSANSRSVVSANSRSGSVKLGKNRITFSISREVDKKVVKEKRVADEVYDKQVRGLDEQIAALRMKATSREEGTVNDVSQDMISQDMIHDNGGTEVEESATESCWMPCFWGNKTNPGDFQEAEQKTMSGEQSQASQKTRAVKTTAVRKKPAAKNRPMPSIRIESKEEEVNKTETRKKLFLGGLFKSKKTKKKSEKSGGMYNSRGHTLDAKSTSSRAGSLPSNGYSKDAGSVASTRSGMSLTVSRARRSSRSHGRVGSGRKSRSQENLSMKNESRIRNMDAGSVAADRPTRSSRSQRSTGSRGRSRTRITDTGSVATDRSRRSSRSQRSTRSWSRGRSLSRGRVGWDGRIEEKLSKMSNRLRSKSVSSVASDRSWRSSRSQRSNWSWRSRSRSRGRVGWKNRIEESFSKKSSGNKDEIHLLDMKLFPDAGDNFVGRNIFCCCADSRPNDISTITDQEADSAFVDSVVM